MSKPDLEIRHLITMSGGIGSWSASKRVVAKYGRVGVVYLFADTFIEDDDLYRFLIQGSANTAGVYLYDRFDRLYRTIPPLEKMEERKKFLKLLAALAMKIIPGLVWINEGRTPWEVMSDRNIIGNSKIDPCSFILKRKMLDRWRNENTNIDAVTIHLGLDWTEHHRIDRVNFNCSPWHYDAPMAEKPYLSKKQMIEQLSLEKIELPRLYKLGFSHNNCGGFCIKAGQAHFALLLKTMPDRYAYHERHEEMMRVRVGNHSILRESRGGISYPLPLKDFRERIEKRIQFDIFDWGGCGCALADEVNE